MPRIVLTGASVARVPRLPSGVSVINRYQAIELTQAEWDALPTDLKGLFDVDTSSPGEVGALPITPFGNVPVSERTPQIELKSIYGLSDLRDSTVGLNGGTVTHPGPGLGGEYALVTAAAANSSAMIESVERGRYQPGASAEAGIGVRISSVVLTGEQVARWGYYDDNDGFGFYRKANEYGVFIRRGGVDQDMPQSTWSVDKLDGNGRSGLVFDLEEGLITQVQFPYYGFGPIEWQVLLPDAVTGKQRNIVLHRLKPSRQTSVLNPNLPLRAEISNGATAQASPTFFMGSRQFSVLGRYEPVTRTTAGFRGSVANIGAVTWVPLISFRRKDAYESVSVRPSEYTILVAGADVELMMRTNMDLVNPVWGPLNNTDPGETALQMDTAATIDGTLATGAGHKRWDDIHPAGQGQRSAVATVGLAASLRGLEPITYLVRSLTGTATVSIVGRFSEEW